MLEAHTNFGSNLVNIFDIRCKFDAINNNLTALMFF